MMRLSKLALAPLMLVAALTLSTPAGAANLTQPNAVARSLQMVSSGWRLELTTLRGAGAIVRVDRAGRPSYYAGEGSCRLWSQQQLASVYMSIVRSLDADHADLPTVG
jgi:hypothetical protein